MLDQPCDRQITQEIVIRDGEPVWRLCIGSRCVENRSGAMALDGIREVAASLGVEIGGDGLQCRKAPEIGPVPDGRYGEPGT